MARITPFGISALSKSNKDIAYVNEIMCNKEIGEMCVKTPDNDTISYNYFTRLRTAINTLSASSLQYSANGNMYSIKPTGINELPAALSTHTLDLGLNIEEKSKGFMMSIDAIGLITIENKLSTIDINKIEVIYTLIVTLDDGRTINVNKRVNLNDLSTDYIEFPSSATNIYISDIILTVDETISEDYILILNNVLFFISR